MLIYILILLLIVFNIYRFDIKNSPSNKLKNFYIIILLLFLISGFRYHIGIDSVRYELSFERTDSLFSLNSNNLAWRELTQPLWFLINSFFREFTDNFVVIQLFHSAIFHILLARFILKSCIKPYIALGVIFCVAWWNFSFEIMRESLCVLIYLNSLFYLKEKKYKKYIFCALVSMGIHWFSFAVFLITPLVNFTRRKWLFTILIFLGMLIFAVDASGVAEIINSLTFILGDSAGDRVNSYIESDTYGVISLSLLGVIFIFLTQILYPIIVSKYLSKSPDSLIYSKILLLYIIFVILRTKIMIFDRFSNYLVLLLIVYSINVLSDRRILHMNIFSRMYLYFGLLFLIFQGVNSFISPSTLELRSNITYDCRYIPYKTIFQEPDDIREELYSSYIVF